MVTVLMVVTLVSLVMTIALSVLVIRLMREERRRSDARVEALAQIADADHADRTVRADGADAMSAAAEPVYTRAVERAPEVAFQPKSTAARTPPPAPVAIPTTRVIQAPPPPPPAPVPVQTRRLVVDESAYDYDSLDDMRGSTTASADLFRVAPQRSPWPSRLGVAAVIATLVVTVGLALRSRSATTAALASLTAASTRPTSSDGSGLLELMSLKHVQDADTLTITGLVQNPRDGVALPKVVATALLFGADGTFLASGRAPLDFTVLRPGDASGFVISVPVTAPVARYRVGFRGDDGRVIGHVDRRGTTTMALNGTRRGSS
jgi:hypothetical protein